MIIAILPSAMADLLNGAAFYEEQEEGLGAGFLDALFLDIEALQLHAGVHRKVFDCHRMLSKRFPYFIYYVKESDRVLVKAVLDCRRDPEWITKRLGG